MPLDATSAALTSSLSTCPPLEPRASPNTAPEFDAAEKDAFEKWLMDRWEKKDALMERFYQEGDFVQGRAALRVVPAAPECQDEFVQFPLAPSSLRQEMAHFLLVPLTLLLAYMYSALGRLAYSSLVAQIAGDANLKLF